jgi:hypothetical protein
MANWGSRNCRGDAKVLTNCNYDKTKLLVELNKLIHFIDKHALKDAEKDGHPLCVAEYQELLEDLDKHAHKLRIAVEGLSKEGKYQ